MNKSTQKTTLYRYFNADKELLYVGVTKNPFERQNHHYTNQLWWSEVASATFEHFFQRDAALEAETLAIGSEFPKYNKAGPVLQKRAREHLAQIMGGYFDDDEHLSQTQKMAITMEELNQFSRKTQAHKLLFAFGESIEWDDEGVERMVFCNSCQEILDSNWFKKLYEQVHSEVCDEAVNK